MSNLVPKVVAEFFGTALLVCVVVGSGIMGMKLSNDTGIALLINTVSTILALALIIYTLTPLSGAHLNPVVTLVELFSGKISPVQVFSYVVAQMMGAVSGAILANTMFDLSPIQISTKARDSLGMLIGEVIATAGLIIVIGVLSSRGQAKLVPLGVSSWIGSAYLFTSSTSFANPAVTVGRIFSDTFSGIEPGSVLNFIVAQLVGAGVGLLAVRSLAKA